jgi:hypothetical protein
MGGSGMAEMGRIADITNGRRHCPSENAKYFANPRSRLRTTPLRLACPQVGTQAKTIAMSCLILPHRASQYTPRLGIMRATVSIAPSARPSLRLPYRCCSSGILRELRNVRKWAIVLKKSASAPAGTGLKSRQAYLPFQAGAICAGIGTSLAILRRFWAVAASRNSSLAPFGPRRRKRSSFRMRLRCANSISTFLRCRRDVT